jgi:hypothetical protein
MDLRSLQKPLKERYRADPSSSRITLTARGSQTDAPIACSVDIGRGLSGPSPQRGGRCRHRGVLRGPVARGVSRLRSDYLPDGCQRDGNPIEAVDVVVEGDLDLQGTLGISKAVPVGFESIRARFEIDAPGATAEQLAALHEKTEQYCVVMQTLTRPPALQVEWGSRESR